MKSDILISIIFLIIFHFIIAYTLTKLSIPIAYKMGFLDKGIYDSNGNLILKPLPRCGGIGIIISFVLFLFLNNNFYHFFHRSIFLPERFLFMIIALSLLLVLGLVDDRFGLGADIKLPVQLCVSILLISGGFVIGLPLLPDPTINHYLNIFVTIVWFIVVINSFNIIDGLDNLAGGTAMIALFFLIIFDVLILKTQNYAQLLILIACIGGFMILNMHPAKTLMGDTGSTFLGAIIAIYTIKMGIAGRVSVILLIPIFLLLYPFLDTFLAVIRRTIRYIRSNNNNNNGISLNQYFRFIFTGDREHIHHQIVRRNGDHRKAVRILLSINFVLGILSIIFFFSHIVVKFIVLFVLFIGIAIILVNLGYLPGKKIVDSFKVIVKNVKAIIYLGGL